MECSSDNNTEICFSTHHLTLFRFFFRFSSKSFPHPSALYRPALSTSYTVEHTTHLIIIYSYTYWMALAVRNYWRCRWNCNGKAFIFNFYSLSFHLFIFSLPPPLPHTHTYIVWTLPMSAVLCCLPCIARAFAPRFFCHLFLLLNWSSLCNNGLNRLLSETLFCSPLLSTVWDATPQGDLFPLG